MSQYKTLDDAILKRLEVGGLMPLIHLNAREVRAESERLANAMGREAFRVLDGRLSALRKAGAITFIRGPLGGWKFVRSNG
jgi:DNA-binding IscR family transcriptional regulator